MKMSKTLRVMGFVMAIVLAMGVGSVQAQEKCAPKVDNFILFVDQSGSMYMTFEGKDIYRGTQNLKIKLAKQLLMEMNEIIPALSYKGGLDLFAPFQQLLAPAPYDRAQMGKALQSIKDNQEIFGRLTPMGPGIVDLDPVLAKLTGKTAIILVSDGAANLGADPVAEAKTLRSKYGQACFHIISFADEPKGKKILEDIAKLDSCTVFAQGSNLLSDKAAMKKFVMDVFCGAPVVAAKEEAMILRGINFDFDKYNIKPQFEAVLNEAAATLMKRPEIKIVIEGHTDSIGSVEYNQKLSERRAKSVYDYFLKKGVSASRMKTIGYGKSRPKADNATEEGRAINRRVELKVMQ